jgi:hypothetical protein
MVRRLLPSLLGLALALTTARGQAEPVTMGETPKPPVRAAPDSTPDLGRARELFVEGSKLAEAGDWEGARDRFERSLKIKRSTLTLYNLGIAQQETGRWVAAIESFRAFLAQPVEPATAGYVEPVRTVLSMLEARVPRVEIEVRPPGVQGLVVRIDGREIQKAEGWKIIDPGHHDFAASAPSFYEVYRTTSLVEGTTTTVVLPLQPLAPLPPSTTLPAALAGVGAALLLGGGITIGIGAGGALRSPPQPGSTRILVAGGIIEGAGAVTLGAAALSLLTRGQARPARAALAPWVSGRMAGVTLRF